MGLGLCVVLLLAAARPGPAEATVDLRDYIVQPDPGFRHRGRFFDLFDVYLSIDGHLDRGEWSQGVVVEAGNPYGLPAGAIWGVHYVSMGPAFLIGPYRDLGGPYGPWRCFSDIGEACSPRMASYPPQAAPLVLTVPIIEEKPSEERVTTSVSPVHPTWTGHDVWLLDPSTCLGYHREQRIWQRVRVFILAELDFKGDLGVRKDVLVLEQESRSSLDFDDAKPPAAYAHGHRVERYYFVGGAAPWGLARQTGRNSTKADGIFDAPIGDLYNDVWWTRREAGDFNATPICVQPSLPWAWGF